MSGQSRLALHDQGAPPQAVYAVFRDALGGTGCPEFNACAHGAKTVVRAVNCAGPPSGINSDPSTHGNAASNHHERCSTISIGKEEPHWLHPFVTPPCVFPTPLAPPASTFSCRGILASWVESSRLSGSWSHRGHSTQARDSSTHCNFRARYCHSRILLRSKASSRVK